VEVILSEKLRMQPRRAPERHQNTTFSLYHDYGYQQRTRIEALDDGDDRAFDVAVAGPAALLVAKSLPYSPDA
jgi:inorganic pyrophosphatase